MTGEGLGNVLDNKRSPPVGKMLAQNVGNIQGFLSTETKKGIRNTDQSFFSFPLIFLKNIYGLKIGVFRTRIWRLQETEISESDRTIYLCHHTVIIL